MKTKQYLRDRNVAERYDLSVSSVWRLSNEGILPKPIKLAPNTSRWSLAELEEYESRCLANEVAVDAR